MNGSGESDLIAAMFTLRPPTIEHLSGGLWYEIKEIKKRTSKMIRLE